MVLYPPPKYEEYFREVTFPGKKVQDNYLGVLMACMLLASSSEEYRRVRQLSHPERVEILKRLGFKEEL